MMADTQKIAVIGLGYVGLPLAVEFGKTRPVIGFDINQTRIDALRDGQCAFAHYLKDQILGTVQVF